MRTRPKVFLSHTTRDRRDHALAHALARGLRARGANVWIAPDSIPPGDQWAEKLLSGIMQECTAFLVIVSAASRDAEWVGREIQLAQARANEDPAFRVLPLRVGAVGDHPHSEFLDKLQDIPYHDAFKEQLDEVIAAIGLRPQTRVTLPPSAVSSQEFVGREYVFDAIRQFIDGNPSGYFVIEADPGAGKTALLAEFARREDAIAHYNIRSLAITTASQFLTSVCSQLIERFALTYHAIPEDATKSGALLMELLGEAANLLAEGQHLVLAIDALDEADLDGHPDGANILFLPPKLPERVFIVMTRRNVQVPFATLSAYELCKLSTFADDTRRDASTYITRALREDVLRQWAESRSLCHDAFVATMTDKSEGNFMYLRHVLPALARGDYEDLAIEKLPQGLQQYYDDHWRRMRMTAQPLPVSKIRVVYILAEVKRPVSRALISQFSTTNDLTVSEVEVQAILDEWSEFLHELRGEVPAYSVYHASFRDFLHRKDIVQAAGVTLPGINALIADDLWSISSTMASLTEKLDSLDAERRRYTLETLAGHLDAAGQHGRLQSLFASSDWMHARVRSDRFRYDGYLEDVAIGFRNARGRVAADEACLVQALRLALISSTVTSLAGSLPTSLVAEAVKRSIWPAARAIGIATTMESSLDQRALGWELLEIDHLADSEREELQDLLDSVERTRSVGSFEYWAEMRQSMDEVQGRWAPHEVVDRSLALLCAVEPLLTLTLRVGESVYDRMGEHVYEGPLIGKHQRAETDDIRAALAKDSPESARTFVLAMLNKIRTMARRGFEAIRSVPGFSDAERAEAAALLTFALEPSAPTLGMPRRALKKCARLLDAVTVVRIAETLTASQAKTLVEAVLHSRARVKLYKGNPNRARALAALAARLPAKKRESVLRKAVKELVRVVETVQKGPKRRKEVPKWRGLPMEVTDPDGGEVESVVVFFDDHAGVDEGIDVEFSSYVEDLSNLEIAYASFGAAVEALAENIPEEELPKLLSLAVFPFREYGWVCVRVLCALEPRLTGQLAEVRDDLIERSLETLERLPEELRMEHWRRLAPLLDGARLERALSEHRAVHDENSQARAFATLTPRRGGGFMKRQAEKQLKWAEQLKDGEKRLRALASIAPLLDETTEDWAVELALNLGCSAHAMRAVALLLPHLSEGRRTSAVEKAYERGVQALSEPDNNYEDAQLAEAWAALMPFLAPEQRSAGLQDASALQLGPFLDKTAMDHLEGYRWEMPKELLLLVHSCAGHLLSPAEQAELLEEIDTLPSAKDRLDCLLQLVPCLSPELRTLGADSAWDIAVGAEDSLSTSKVAEWVSMDRMTSTLAGLDYSTPWARQLVSAIADHVTSDLLDMVLTLTADIPNRLDFLISLMGNLGDSGRAEAVQLARSVADAKQRWSAISALMPFMDAQARREAIADRLADLRGRDRSEVLAFCAEQGIVGTFSDEAVAAITEDIVEICQNWNWL
jgi:TIR domain